jgi:hypothetical protein
MAASRTGHGRPITNEIMLDFNPFSADSYYV